MNVDQIVGYLDGKVEQLSAGAFSWPHGESTEQGQLQAYRDVLRYIREEGGHS